MPSKSIRQRDVAGIRQHVEFNTGGPFWIPDMGKDRTASDSGRNIAVRPGYAPCPDCFNKADGWVIVSFRE